VIYSHSHRIDNPFPHQLASQPGSAVKLINQITTDTNIDGQTHPAHSGHKQLSFSQASGKKRSPSYKVISCLQTEQLLGVLQHSKTAKSGGY